MPRDDLYRSVLIASIACVALIMISFFVMRQLIKADQGFSEIYFTNPEKLPHRLTINGIYNVSFLISNHELNVSTYVYEIDSKSNKTFDEITLNPGESALISTVITPKERGWEINFSSDSAYDNKLDLTDSVSIGTQKRLGFFLDNISAVDYLPLSHELSDFGFIYHTNLSVDELKKKPFSKYIKKESIGENQSTVRFKNITLSIKDDELYVTSNERLESYSIKKEPFSVRLYRKGYESEGYRNIYFWCEVV